MKKDFIQVLVTGGTFDKEYDYITGELFFKNTHLSEMFDTGRSKLKIDLKTLMMIDSLDMTETDREIILHNCINSKSDKIVITHGTDTMEVTAKLLAAKEIPFKTIVITGAMIPFAFGDSSDGFFNLGSALAFAQVLPPGVYVAMNGMYFHADNVKKNKSSGYFERIE